MNARLPSQLLLYVARQRHMRKVSGMGITISRYAVTTIIISLCIVFKAGEGHTFTILSPTSDKPIHIKKRRAQSTLIIRTSSQKEADSLRVKSMGKGGDTPHVESQGIYEINGEFFMHYTLSLRRGKNVFAISPGKQKLQIQYQPVRTLINTDFEEPDNYLFHRKAVNPDACKPCHSEKLPGDSGFDLSQLEKNADFSPLCFSCHQGLHTNNEWLHGPAANLYCFSCHRKEKGNTAITMLTGKVDKVCFQCHTNKRKFENLKHVHGPVGTGDCTICHDPHGDTHKFQLWADGKVNLCLGCHGDKRGAVKEESGFFQHGIIRGFGCVACHSPHATNYRFQLYKPINDLCISCHLGFVDIEKGHPVGSHPVSNRKDPRREGRELSCTSCHIPHGSPFSYLLIGDVLGGHVCSKCHNK